MQTVDRDPRRHANARMHCQLRAIPSTAATEHCLVLATIFGAISRWYTNLVSLRPTAKVRCRWVRSEWEAGYVDLPTDFDAHNVTV
jgi:hypothetical protein